MSDPIVHDAFNRVRSRYTDDVWFALPPRVITNEIYSEMRRIDAERLGKTSSDRSIEISAATA